MQLLSLFTTAPAPVAPAEEGGTPAGHAPTGLFGALLSRLRGLPAPEEPAPEASGTAFGAVHEHDVTLVAGTLPSESVPVTGKERLPEQAVSTHPEEAGATGAVAPPQETSRPAPVVEAGTGAPSPDAGEASDHTPPGPSSDDAAPPQALPPVREPLLPVHATGIRDTGPSPDGSTRPARTGPSVQGTAGTPAASDSDPAPLPPRTDGKPAPLPPRTDETPAPLPPRIEEHPAPLPPRTDETPAPLPPRIEEHPAPLPPRTDGKPAPLPPQAEKTFSSLRPQAEGNPAPTGNAPIPAGPASIEGALPAGFTIVTKPNGTPASETTFPAETRFSGMPEATTHGRPDPAGSAPVIDEAVSVSGPRNDPPAPETVPVAAETDRIHASEQDPDIPPPSTRMPRPASGENAPGTDDGRPFHAAGSPADDRQTGDRPGERAPRSPAAARRENTPEKPPAPAAPEGQGTATPAPAVPEDAAPEMPAEPPPDPAPEPVRDAGDRPLKLLETTLGEVVRSLREPGRPAPRGPVSAAWLRTVYLQSTRGQTTDDGWKMLELRLDDGDGTMTIKARRDAERVIVAVSFSDPHLRLLASENADRLQEALRQQYDASVDLSLAGEDAGASSRHHENGQDSPASFARVSRVHDREAGAGPVLRRAGARHVWVG